MAKRQARRPRREWVEEVLPGLDGGPAKVRTGSRAKAPTGRQLGEDLRAVRDELVALDARRHELLTERDGLVAACRTGGAPWSVVERWAGVSRPALLKRGAATLVVPAPVTWWAD